MTYRTAQNYVRAYHKQIAAARKNYEVADELLRKLRKQFGIGNPITTRAGVFVIVDNFAEKDSAYKPARISRYELKEVKPVRSKSAKAK